MIGCKFNGGVNVIEISIEGLEVVKGVCPYHEDVVLIRNNFSGRNTAWSKQKSWSFYREGKFRSMTISLKNFAHPVLAR